MPLGSLASIFSALGAPRAGLALQWRCLLAVLPLVAAVQRVLLYKLGLGRPDAPAAATGSRAGQPDASYRRAAAAGASSSLDSGVHVSKDPAQAQKEAAALSAVAGLASKSAPAYSLAGLADSVEPCGSSFSSFLHTTDMPPTGIFRLLQVAPLLVSVLWGALLWAGVQAVRWGHSGRGVGPSLALLEGWRAAPASCVLCFVSCMQHVLCLEVGQHCAWPAS